MTDKLNMPDVKFHENIPTLCYEEFILDESDELQYFKLDEKKQPPLFVIHLARQETQGVLYTHLVRQFCMRMA